MPFIGWRDLIDIALNSYILFRLYILLRGTRLLRVGLVIGLLWGIQRIAANLGLVVTTWAMQGVITVAALVVIIVFRDEVRGIFQARNIKSLLWGLPNIRSRTPIQILVRSAFDLAQRQHGAIVVIPGQRNLEGFIQQGVAVDGEVSAELVGSIFWPDNPLHDGAVLVSGNRVTQAGALLPLSSRTDFPSYYGTRHRAAAGLSEVSDALIIVVSEERGQITVARKERLVGIRRERELERMLSDHLGPTPVGESRFIPAYLESAVVALFAVLIVGGLWLSFSKGLEAWVDLKIPVEYMNRNPSVEILDTSVNTVSLQLAGPGPIVKRLGPEQVKIRLDLEGVTAGEHRFAITDERITLPPGVALKDADPESVTVRIDVPGVRKLPVQVDWTGRLAANLRMVEVTLEPAAVAVSGGEQILTHFATLYTLPVPLTGLTVSEGTLSARLAPLAEGITPVAGQPKKVTIRYRLAPRQTP
ncbi:MAG: diadenylate cyclase [Desulfobacterales bacterium]